jgi:hypothetical protein
MNTIRKIIKEQLLTEKAGISEIVRKWATILKKEVDEKLKTHREEQAKKYPSQTKSSSQLSIGDIFDVSLDAPKDPKDDPFYWEDDTSKGKSYYKKGYNDYMQEDYRSGYNYSRMYETLDEIVVYGEDYPEEYKEFSVDLWVLTNSNRIEYDHYDSGYDEDGNYIVYLNIPLMGMSMSTFIHEIKHAYDDWNRMRTGGKPIRDSWEIKNIYTKDFEKLILGASRNFPQLGPLIRNYYMGSKLETPAYLENEYDDAMVNYQDTGRKLMNFKASTFMTKEGEPAKGLEAEFKELQKYDIPLFKKFNNVLDFLKYTEKYFNQRGKDIFRRVNKMRYVHGLPAKKEPIKWEPKPTTQKTKSEKDTEQDIFSSAEEFGDWKYSNERGWYYAGKGGENFNDYYY